MDAQIRTPSRFGALYVFALITLSLVVGTNEVSAARKRATQPVTETASVPQSAPRPAPQPAPASPVAPIASPPNPATPTPGPDPQQEQLPVQPNASDTQRQRQEWFFQQRAFPLGFVPSQIRTESLRETDLKRQALQSRQALALGAGPQAALFTGAWRLIGPQPTHTPFNVPVGSGRVSAIAVDPRNANVVYLGATLGGVWKTTDGGQNWIPLTDNQPSLSVGSIVLDPGNPDIVYVGTGDLSSFYGAGILKSVDGGNSWTNIPGPFVGPFGPDKYFGSNARIVSLSIHPTNSQILLAGAWRWPQNQAGIFRSTDAGATWTQVLSGPGGDVVFDPTNGNVAYTAIGSYYGFSGSGI